MANNIHEYNNYNVRLIMVLLTCVSFNCNAFAISMRRALVKYLLKWNSFSSSVSCLFVKLVRPVLLLLFNNRLFGEVDEGRWPAIDGRRELK